MRLFIAIPIPENLHKYCRKLQNQFDGLRKTNDFHLTLQFLGNSIEEADKIIEVLGQVEFQSFQIEMGDAAPFSSKTEPRGIWIECKKNEALKELAQKIRKHMSSLGYGSDKPFRAHITLGRYKRLPGNLPEKIKGSHYRFTVNHFELLQSNTEENGPHYKILKKFFAK